MADKNRTTVDYLVLHHAVTPLWSSKSKKELAQWFSDNGFKRAYSSNTNNWSGLYNPYTGAKSYSQAHYAGQRVNSTTQDATPDELRAGFRLVPLVKDVWGQITWHAGDWAKNCASIGIECLGDYRNYTLRDNDCRVIADFWRPQDVKLNGKTAILGHKEIKATICPARIMEKRDLIVSYCNDPNQSMYVINERADELARVQAEKATADKLAKEKAIAAQKALDAAMEAERERVAAELKQKQAEDAQKAKEKEIAKLEKEDTDNFVKWLKDIFIKLSELLVSWRK